MDMRIYDHPILRFERGKSVRFYFEGREMRAYDGESIAAALFANGIRVFTTSGWKGRPRGAFCMIGQCSSCMMTVDGVPNVRTCVEGVRDGITVERLRGPGEIRPEGGVRETKNPPTYEYEVVVLGGGPAGLAAAMESARLGAKTLLIEKNDHLGGQLIKQTHKFFGSVEHFAGVRGFEIARIMEKMLRESGADVWLNSNVIGYYEGNVLGVVRKGPIREGSHVFEERYVNVRAKRIIFGTGARERFLVFENNDLPGVMGAGAAQTLMNVYGIKPAERMLMVGGGNVGLIVAYQLLQAGVEVVGVVEAMPRIGGYFVHAAKIRRLGIPIHTRHTVVRAIGEDHVEGAVIVELDERWRPVPGTEMEVECDGIALAVGLSPTYPFLQQAGVELRYVPSLGGFAPVRDENLQTNVEGIYVAGDLASIEEASTAMIEGHIAGIAAATSLGYTSPEAEERVRKMKEYLNEFRSGPFGKPILEGIERVRR